MDEWQRFALSTAAILIGAMASILWWFVRDKMKTRLRAEELLHKRLGEGSKTMGDIRKDVAQVQTNTLTMMAKVIDNDQCKLKHDTHQREHDKIDKRFDMMNSQMSTLDGKVSKLDGKVEEGFSQLTDLLAKKLEVGFSGKS